MSTAFSARTADLSALCSLGHLTSPQPTRSDPALTSCSNRLLSSHAPVIIIRGEKKKEKKKKKKERNKESQKKKERQKDTEKERTEEEEERKKERRKRKKERKIMNE